MMEDVKEDMYIEYDDNVKDVLGNVDNCEYLFI